MGLFIGYYLVNKITITINGRKPKAEIDYEGYYCRSARKLSRYVFFFTYAFFVLTVIDKILFVFRYGYVSYYINYTPSINALSVSAPAAGDAMIGILTDLDTATWKNINVTNYVISSVRGIVTTGLGSTGTSDDYYNNVTIIK